NPPGCCKWSTLTAASCRHLVRRSAGDAGRSKSGGVRSDSRCCHMRIDSLLHRDEARVVAQIHFSKRLIDNRYQTIGGELVIPTPSRAGDWLAPLDGGGRGGGWRPVCAGGGGGGAPRGCPSPTLGLTRNFRDRKIPGPRRGPPPLYRV